MSAQITVTDIQRRGAKLYVRFSDGTEVEGTRRELREECRTLLDNVALTGLLKTIAIAKGLRASADADDADDLDALIGKIFTFNPRAVQNICRMT